MEASLPPTKAQPAADWTQTLFVNFVLKLPFLKVGEYQLRQRS